MIERIVPKSALFREAAVKFIFDYQTVGPYAGMYVCTDNIQNLMRMNMNTVYLLSNISISCTLPETQLVESLQQDNIIGFNIRRYQRNELLSAQQFKISQYYREKSISSHVVCNRSNDGIKLEMLGRLDQIPATIGVASIAFAVSVGTYEIDGTEYNAFFRDKD